MTTITLADMQRDPLPYLQRAAAGETLLVVQGERAMAEIKPAEAARQHRRPSGLCAGEFTVPADFDSPLPEQILQDFEGR